MTNGTSLSKPSDDTVRTWSIHSRTVINKATRGAGISSRGKKTGGVGWFVAGKYSKAG